MRNDLPSGTVTFLFTDVEGSTRLLHGLGPEVYADFLDAHRRVVRKACAARRGVEIDTQGDAFFVAFHTAPDAVDAALAITEELASGPITVRIGLHTGTPIVTSEGYVGEDVHLAARVAASAHGGQVVLSRASYTLLSENYPVLELGEHRLKDIPEPVTIFQLGDRQFPPLKTISNTNLPSPPSSFVGRERELSEVLARIEGGARLVTLTGPGGSGKTRLALEAATRFIPEYTAGVFWVGLASLRDPALVTEAIARTLGAKNGLAAHIQERHMLLLLDNFEQVIDAAPDIAALLTVCPNLTLLITSRELLRVQGELEYQVLPLAEQEAVSLFSERTQLVQSPEVAELCRRLDNLPLAVELAAARTNTLSTAQILDRLSHRLDLFKGRRDADPRQQTLRATIEWSHDLLSDDEQRLFRRLSVFAGSWRLEAAEAVCGADIDTLASLVEKSLIRLDSDRFWILETIREYAIERCELDGPAYRDVIRQRHAEYFLGLARAFRTAHIEGKGRDQLRSMEAESANFRAALKWLRCADERVLELELAVALGRYWISVRHVNEGRDALTQALRRAKDAPASLRVRAFNGVARLAYVQGDYDTAQASANAALALARTIQNEESSSRELRNALSNVAAAHLARGDLEQSVPVLEEVVRLETESDQHLDLFASKSNLGYARILTGDIEGAVAELEQAVELSRDYEDWVTESQLWFNLGLARLRTEELPRARASFRESLRCAVKAGMNPGVGYAFLGLAAVAAANRDSERAATLLGLADTMLEAAEQQLEPYERRLHDNLLESVRQRLGDESFSKAVQQGLEMPPDKAIDFALEQNITG